MNLDDQLPGVRMNLDERLRAAGNALREGSATQVDAAGGCGRSSTPAAWRLQRHPALPGEPVAPAPAGPPRRTRRLALAVNLVLVLVLGVVVGVVGARRGERRRRPEPTGQHRRRHQHRPAERHQTLVQVPEACLDAADLADEVISRLNRNDRDNRLALALRDYSVASQACRRQAAP